MNDNTIARIREWTAILQQVVTLTEQAAQAYMTAVEQCRSPLPLLPSMRADNLARMARTFKMTAELGHLVLQWLDILPDAFDAFKAKDCPDQLVGRIESLKMNASATAVPLKAKKQTIIDLNGADVSQALLAIDFLLEEADNILHTLKSGEFRDAHIATWW